MRLENLGLFTDKLTAESVNVELCKNAVSWEPWEIADGVMPGDPKFANTHPDSDTLHDFYHIMAFRDR